MVVEDAACEDRHASTDRIGAWGYVANRPIIHHVLDALDSAGAQDVIVVSSARLAEDVRECLSMRQNPGVARLHYRESPAPLEAGGALRLALPVIDGAPCIVHLASGLLDEPLEQLVERLRSDSSDAVITVHHDRQREGRLSAAPPELLRITPPGPQGRRLFMAGVCLFGAGVLQGVSSAAWRASNGGGVAAIAQSIAAAGGTFRVLAVKAWHHYSGDPLDLLELNRIALDRLEAGTHSSVHDHNRIEGRVRIDELASVRNSVIIGPTVIGRGAQVSDAYIGPYTSIGAGARIEGAEIEQSIIAAGAIISHVGGRLVASVVGREARVFRDFSLPRALRLRVGDGTEVALC